LLFGFAGFSESFSDVAQNITNAPHIMGWVGVRVGGWGGVDGMGGGLRLTFRHNETSCCAKGAVNGLQTTLKDKAGRLMTVMDDWEQFHTNATLLKPASIVTVLSSSLYRVMKKSSEKEDLAICSYSVVVFG